MRHKKHPSLKENEGFSVCMPKIANKFQRRDQAIKTIPNDTCIKDRSFHRSKNASTICNSRILECPKEKTKSPSISVILKEVRNEMCEKIDLQKMQTLKKKHFQAENLNRQLKINKKQRKVNQPTEFEQKKAKAKQQEKQMAKNQSLFRFTRMLQTVQVDQIQSMQKPPHRYKTMMSYDSTTEKLHMYGGIGCEMDLKMAEYDFKLQGWNYPKEEQFAPYHPTTPISGHSFNTYKGRGFIYGGSSTDLLNEISIVNLKTNQITEGSKCLYRRKDHASVMMGKYLFIHGGIEANQLMNNLYYYDTETNEWGYFSAGRSSSLPYLSHHSICTTFTTSLKTKKKALGSSTLSQVIDGSFYIFGGKNKRDSSSDKLYRVTIQGFDSLKVDEIKNECSGDQVAPCKRFSCCFEYVGNDKLLLYGGRQTQQEQQQEVENGKKGIRRRGPLFKKAPFNSFDDVYTFDTEALQWTQQKASGLSLTKRYGMASASVPSNGKVYIFGGFNEEMYANANITVLTY